METLKTDLMKRIKMLEYALRHERLDLLADTIPHLHKPHANLLTDNTAPNPTAYHY
jgi:hypothetical protein